MIKYIPSQYSSIHVIPIIKICGEQFVINDNTYIPVMFNIHVEPEMRVIEYKKKRWLGYENLHAFLLEKRTDLEKSTGRPVNYNWLFRLDPQIQHVYGKPDWAMQQYRTLINEAATAGDEIGVHVHSWRPYQKWWRKSWVAEFSDGDWIRSCVDMAHHAFVDSMQLQPKSFSFGDQYMSDDVLTQLEILGYRCDISMHPKHQPKPLLAKGEKHTGNIPDYQETPRRPFKPSHKNFTKPISGDERSIWEIPPSVGKLENQENTNISYHQKLLLGIPFDRIPKIVDQNLALPDPYLLAEMRTDVRMDAYNRTQFDQAVEYFMNHALSKNMSFSTLADFTDHLDTRLAKTLAGNNALKNEFNSIPQPNETP